MRRSEFKIGCTFYTWSGRWRCTDVGTRTIVAIRCDDEDDDWLTGPPYAVDELVFDEFDLDGCYPHPPRST